MPKRGLKTNAGLFAETETNRADVKSVRNQRENRYHTPHLISHVIPNRSKGGNLKKDHQNKRTPDFPCKQVILHHYQVSTGPDRTRLDQQPLYRDGVRGKSDPIGSTALEYKHEQAAREPSGKGLSGGGRKESRATGPFTSLSDPNQPNQTQSHLSLAHAQPQHLDLRRRRTLRRRILARTLSIRIRRGLKLDSILLRVGTRALVRGGAEVAVLGRVGGVLGRGWLLGVGVSAVGLLVVWLVWRRGTWWWCHPGCSGHWSAAVGAAATGVEATRRES